MNIVEFECAICKTRFHELKGGKCAKCGKIVCRNHLHVGKKEMVCSNCFDEERK